ncbi:MAG: hypothetical protein R3C10_02990 [Pirellulales bacterium]
MVASIQYIEEVIDTYAKAAEANRRLPARRGNVVEITEEIADDVMITADLHGHRRNYNMIRQKAALDEHPRRHLVMQEVCHGGPTYPENGGCMSHTMLEDVAKLKAKYPERVHFILSNHEMAELTDYPILKAKKMLNLMFRLGMQQMYGPATEKVREAALDFIRSLPIAVRLPGGIFICHTIPEEVDRQGFDVEFLDRPLEAIDYQEQGPLFRMMWGRDHRAENARAFADRVGARLLINGHEPCPDGFCRPNDVQLILDCCNEKGSYVIVPVGGPPLDHASLVERVERLA